MEPTYVFKQGKVYTIVGGKVVAAVKEADFQENDGHEFEDGWRLHRLKKNQEYIDEGNLMQNCLGDGCDPNDPEGPASGQYGQKPTWSLRDPEGNPKANYSPDIGPWGPANAEVDDDILGRLQQWDPSVRRSRTSSSAGFGKTAGPAEQFMEPVDNFEESDPEIAMPDPPDDLQSDLIQDIDSVSGEVDGHDVEVTLQDNQIVDLEIDGEELGDWGGSDEDDFAFDGDMLKGRMIAKKNVRVTTPNGLQGKVMNRVAGLWGDELTIRFDNGRVTKVPVVSGMKFSEAYSEDDFENIQHAAYNVGLEDNIRTDYSGRGMYGKQCFGIVHQDDDQLRGFLAELNELNPELSERLSESLVQDSMGRGIISYWPWLDVNENDNGVVASLRKRLAASVPGDMASLQTRKKDLEGIRHEIRQAFVSASYDEKKVLNNISLEASYEAKEIDDAIQHLVELEGRGFVPTSAFKAQAVEQAELGGKGDGGWMSEVLSSMNEDSQSTDFKRLMNEGPESFVAGSENPVIANAGAMRQAATRYVRSFTSSTVQTTTPAQRSQYERMFLDRVEDCRKHEANARKTAARKEASKVKESAIEAPDDSLFL